MTFKVTSGPAKLTYDERAAGVRANFHVYHRSRHTRISAVVDASYADTPQAAAEQVVLAYAEFGDSVEVYRVHRITAE